MGIQLNIIGMSGQYYGTQQKFLLYNVSAYLEQKNYNCKILVKGLRTDTFNYSD